jgi:hypothetical protein
LAGLKPGATLAGPSDKLSLDLIAVLAIHVLRHEHTPRCDRDRAAARGGGSRASGSPILRLPYVSPLGPLAYFGLTDLVVVVALVYDWRTRGRVHPATLWGGLFLLATQAGRLAVSGTDTWLRIARWLTA